MIKIARFINQIVFFRPSKFFLKVYFAFIVILYLVEMFSPHLEFSYKNSMTLLLSFLGLVPVYGYAFDLKLPSRDFWEGFALVYMAWELGCYTFLYQNPWYVDCWFFLIYGPNYWCLFLYPFETLEDENGHNKISLGRRLGLVLDADPKIKGYQFFICPFCKGEDLKNISWLKGFAKCLTCHRNFKVRSRHYEIFMVACFVSVLIYLVYFMS